MTSRKKEKYPLILDAALKVFAEYGFHGSQVSKIAKEAGVAEGTIYLYFKNKEDILASLLHGLLSDLVETNKKTINETDSADEILRKICENHLLGLEEDEKVNVASVFQNELRQKSPELRKAISLAVKPYFELIEQVLQKGKDEGTFRSDLDVKLTRRLLFGALDEVVALWLYSGRTYSFSSQLDQIVTFFLRGLK